MFHKLVAIEPVSLIPSAEQELHQYAEEVTLYRDIPADDDEIARRIGDADAVLLSYTSRMGKNVIERCPNIRYIGMCCSLYSEESANVDIAYAPLQPRTYRLAYLLALIQERSTPSTTISASAISTVAVPRTWMAAPFPSKSLMQLPDSAILASLS